MAKRVEDNKNNAERCLCSDCPMYNDCTRQAAESLFCARGKSGCELEMLTCICGDCEVHHDYDLKKGYFCVNGSAEETE